MKTEFEKRIEELRKDGIKENFNYARGMKEGRELTLKEVSEEIDKIIKKNKKNYPECADTILLNLEELKRRLK